ncbi:LysE family translocator [Duganella sp. BJB488]|uniref:LysE family translocator n=1 Tax=unclassified Duganella TaxID=2636909 RepID=UPI000E34631E|nr:MULTISPECIES: LysE family translocator [unclassified Duganella]RFP08837.1 LysE family translocator [Duganella sp. BJB489]RFP11543.1 LysE family translocator [Duganella sp. BJB488]RFP28566.1 LysE family translocator [Duganella sp. BJB480]
MFGIHDLTLFVVSGLLLNIMPGPDSLLIMTRSATQGWRAGSAAALGIGAGTMIHIFAAALGLSALLATSAAAFTVVKWIGAAYIVYVGIGMLRARLRTEDDDAAAAEIAVRGAAQPLAYRKIFFQGFLTNVLNPKVALFFLAFVPQFISADSASKPLAFIVLGCIFNFNGMLWCNGLAVFTAFASARLKVKPLVALWLNRVTGGLFLALGLRLALAEQH